MTVPVVVEVSDADRAVLEARVSASTTPRRDWQRARVVLMASEGLSSPVIGEAVGLNRNRVDAWRRRYAKGGVDALADRPRSGRPRVYGPKERLMLVKTITTRPAEPGRLGPRRIKARMSMPEVARRLRERHGIAISDSQVWRICQSMSLKPWQVRSSMTSHDPDFDDKAVDVCGLYLQPEDNWAVFSHTSDLAGAILDYIDDYNNRAQPFKWTYQATNPTNKVADAGAIAYRRLLKEELGLAYV